MVEANKIELKDLFPNAQMGLNNIGFLFGAGASLPAGYPLTWKLTKEVLTELLVEEQELLAAILGKENLELDIQNGVPDIELISDILNKHKNIGGIEKIEDLISSIKSKIIDCILSIKDVNYEYHVKFFEGLKRKLGNSKSTIWIFTTNYDLVIETAAAMAGLAVYNGFEGINYRYFDINSLNLKKGTINRGTFEPLNEPVVKLIKLHGSISWEKNNGKIYERFDAISKEKSCLILPQKTKVVQTLDNPYDSIFRFTNNILGSECEYLVSCGFSYRDQHINEHLIQPKLRDGKINLFALSKERTSEMEELAKFRSFKYGTESSLKINDQVKDEGTDLWDFINLSNLISK